MHYFALCNHAGVIHHVVIVGGAKQCDFDQFISELFTHDFGQSLYIAGFDKRYIILIMPHVIEVLKPD